MNRKVAIIGAGVIGAGWAARFLLNGWDVAVFDPQSGARQRVDDVLRNARRAMPALYDIALPDEGRLSFHDNLRDAIADCSWIQESAPERLDLKHRILSAVAQHAPADAIIASSTSGFRPSELLTGVASDTPVLVAHPFNPVYLLPLVELVAAPQCPGNLVERASTLISSIGMRPLVVRQEIDAHIADRLLEAVWRESLWLIKDGICTTTELDDAIRYGFGLRWAQMGLFETYRLAGGDAGMRHFLAQFGPALQWPWTRLTDVPEFSEELVDLIAGQSDEQSGHMSIDELEHLRDDNLVGIIRALRHTGTGAGSSVLDHEHTLAADRTPRRAASAGDSSALPVTVERVVPPTWTDYNGHMNEAWYLALGSQATDQLLALIGAGADYVESGKSYFTVESHVCHLRELHAGEHLSVTTQVVRAEGRKLQMLHTVRNASGQAAATVESLMLHVDLDTRRSSEPDDEVAAASRALMEQHAGHPLPDEAGRYVGAPRTARQRSH